MGWNDRVSFSELVGKTLTEVLVSANEDEMTFTTESGEVFKLHHSQDCCESVSINDIEGDLSDLIGSPIVLAEESTSNENPEGVLAPEYQDSFTWTFYRLATAKGFVVVRWYGESNGYYSESVDFERV